MHGKYINVAITGSHTKSRLDGKYKSLLQYCMVISNFTFNAYHRIDDTAQ